MVKPTIYEIDLCLPLPKSPPPPSTAAAESAAAFYDITAEFHYSHWPISIARLFPNFRRFYRRASLSARRGGDAFDVALHTVRSLLLAMDLSLPEEIVFGAAQKLLILSSAVAGEPSVDFAPVLPLRFRITASTGLRPPSAAAEREMAQRRRFMAAAEAEAEARIRAARPAAKSAIEALECPAAGSTGDRQGQCPICLEEFTQRDHRDDHDGRDDGRFVRMACSHVYHRDCIVRWLENSHKCPLCGYAMPTDD